MLSCQRNKVLYQYNTIMLVVKNTLTASSLELGGPLGMVSNSNYTKYDI